MCEKGRVLFFRESRQEIRAKVVPFPRGRVPPTHTSLDYLGAENTFKTVLLTNLPIWASKEDIIWLINTVGVWAEKTCAREEGRRPKQNFIVSLDTCGGELVDIRWVRHGRGPAIAGAFLDSAEVDTDYDPDA